MFNTPHPKRNSCSGEGERTQLKSRERKREGEAGFRNGDDHGGLRRRRGSSSSAAGKLRTGGFLSQSNHPSEGKLQIQD